MPVKKERDVYVIADEEERPASREGIARRAFELYLARGGVHGRDVEDWLRAEHELRGEAP